MDMRIEIQTRMNKKIHLSKNSLFVLLPFSNIGSTECLKVALKSLVVTMIDILTHICN